MVARLTAFIGSKSARGGNLPSLQTEHVPSPFYEYKEGIYQNRNFNAKTQRRKDAKAERRRDGETERRRDGEKTYKKMISCNPN